MYFNFSLKFNADNSKDTNFGDNVVIEPLEVQLFMKEFQGQSFNDGIYRVHAVDKAINYTRMLENIFTEYIGAIYCFSYDWLGRQFAVNLNSVNSKEPIILMFEPGTGEVLEIPGSINTFHEKELIEYTDVVLASNFYEDWKESSQNKLKRSRCIGYKVPLFLGGEDTIENLEETDMEVYWNISG
jgi:hypothetical protein